MLNNRKHLDSLRKYLRKIPLNADQNGNKNCHGITLNERLTVKRGIFPDIIQTNILSKYNLKRKERNITKKPTLSASLSAVTRRHSDTIIANNILVSAFSDNSSCKTYNSEPDLGSVWKLDPEQISDENVWKHVHYQNSNSPGSITEHNICTEVYNPKEIQLSCVYKDYSELINQNLILSCDCFDCDPSESTQTIQNKLQKLYKERTRQKEDLQHEFNESSRTYCIDDGLGLRFEPQKTKLHFTHQNTIELTRHRTQESTLKTPKNYLTSFTKQQFPNSFQPAEDHFSFKGYPNSSLVNSAEKSHRCTDFVTDSSGKLAIEKIDQAEFSLMSPQNKKIGGLHEKRKYYDFFKDNPFNNESGVSSKNKYRGDEFVLSTQKAATREKSPFKMSPVMIVKQRNRKIATKRSRFQLDSVVAKNGVKFNSSHFREPLNFPKDTAQDKEYQLLDKIGRRIKF